MMHLRPMVFGLLLILLTVVMVATASRCGSIEKTSQNLAEINLGCDKEKVSLSKELLCCIQFARVGSKDAAAMLALCRHLPKAREKFLNVEINTKVRKICAAEVKLSDQNNREIKRVACLNELLKN